ncbi:mechanosensitive ion channel family protein [Oceaniglobus indicus]|uniref:mechanosensitive ion channel family protein n=1 Tax=Oceaniglobus indicus TaxID=2047749 RepID=UPI000C18DB2D|nr:mechanosensitive ion channel family protein [Oceaniglobus indicus]
MFSILGPFLRLLAFALFTAPVFAQGGPDEIPPQNDTTIEASDLAEQVATDARLRDRIRAILIELEGYEDVNVTVRAGIVTLTGEVLDLASSARLEELIGRMDEVVTIQNEVVETTDLAKRLNPAVERMVVRARQLAAALPLVAIALTVALVVLFVGLRLARMTQPWERLAPNAFIADIYRQMVRIVFGIAGIVIALDILNATALLGTILGAAGIIGLAIGFAVRDTVENFIASVMLSVRQPFQPNDTVEIDGDQGKVIRLTSRATILLSFDGNHIRIPNSTVFKSRIINFTRNPERRFSFDIGVEAESDLKAVRQLIEDTVTAMPFTLDAPGTTVWIQDITDSGVIFTVTGWIDQRTTSLLRARGETLRLVKQAIEDGGFAIPDTTYRIRMDTPPFATLTETSDETAPAPTPPQSPSPRAPTPGEVEVVGIDAQDDEALEEMIATERDDTSNPDLLRRDAPIE